VRKGYAVSEASFEINPQDLVTTDDIEVPEVDAAEQHQFVHQAVDQVSGHVRDDVDPADHADQEREVALDEEDDR
jgi:hypothetical protein